MFEVLDRRQTLTGNQKRIVAAAILGDMLEFFDYFLIGFVLAFVVGPWKLTFMQSAIVLLRQSDDVPLQFENFRD